MTNRDMQQLFVLNLRYFIPCLLGNEHLIVSPIFFSTLVFTLGSTIKCVFDLRVQASFCPGFVSPTVYRKIFAVMATPKCFW